MIPQYITKINDAFIDVTTGRLFIHPDFSNIIYVRDLQNNLNLITYLLAPSDYRQKILLST